MNTENFKYELRLRGDRTPQSTPPQSKKTPGQKTADKSIICLCLLIGVMLLKMSSSAGALKVTEYLGELIHHQMDLSAFAEKADQALNAVLDELERRGGELPAGGNALRFASPVSSGVVTSKFAAGEHPLYSSETAPVGITIETAPGAFVFSAGEGSLIGLSENAEGTKKICILTKDGQCIVCDGLGVCYNELNDALTKGQIVGAMPTDGEKASLCFAVYDENGVALNPLDFIGEFIEEK